MINAYEGIAKNEIEKAYATSRGKEYSINHPEELVIDMKFKGIGASGANAQGWQRDCYAYFRQLSEKHPEYFNKTNMDRIRNNIAPHVNKQFTKHFPQYASFNRQKLIHHHIGRDGQAVAIPQGMHNGQGEIHTIEDNLGITRNAERFSKKCNQMYDKNPQVIGKTATEFKKLFAKQKDTVQLKPSNAIKQIGEKKGQVKNDRVNAISKANTANMVKKQQGGGTTVQQNAIANGNKATNGRSAIKTSATQANHRSSK